jgi:microcystin-dependent protein
MIGIGENKMKHSLKTKSLLLILGTLTTLSFMAPKPAAAQATPWVGQLMLVGFGFCPRSWADASGQLLPINQNQSLFSLYGTMYGGDGRTTFALPDLRGRTPISYGQGPGLANYQQGSRGGQENFTITTAQLPSHNHNVQATDAIADKKGPGLDFMAKVSTPDDAIYHNGPPNKLMDPAVITNTGGNQAITKRSPYLTMRWCVALQGVFPSRN